MNSPLNRNLKDPVNTPPINWDRVLKWSLIGIFVMTVLALFSRARTLILLAGVIDVTVIVILIGISVYALIAKGPSGNSE